MELGWKIILKNLAFKGMAMGKGMSMRQRKDKNEKENRFNTAESSN